MFSLLQFTLYHLVKYIKYIDDVIYYIIHNFGYMGKFLTQSLLYSPTYVLFRFEDFPINMIIPCTFWIPRIVLPLKQFWMRRGIAFEAVLDEARYHRMGFVFTPLDKTVKNLHDHVNNVVQEYET